jgi:aminoglycoside phosphotransferase (APT) family kinase protein
VNETETVHGMKETVGDGTSRSAPLRRALAAADVATSDAAVEAVSLGNRKETHLVRPTSGAPVVVQTSADQAALEEEAKLLKELAATTVPVPEVLAAGTDGDAAFLVTARVDGENLHYRFASLPADQQRNIASAFGRHLGALHQEFTFDGAGEIEVVDGDLRAPGERWQPWFSAYAREAIEGLPAEFDDLRADLHEVVEQSTVAPAPTPRLFPWDFRPGNALARDGTLVAILDWERPLAAAPALAVAKAEFLVADWYVDDPEPLRRAFRRGYETVRPLPDVGPPHRVAAIASSAVDSRGRVTNPRYPELDRDAAVEFHRGALARLL